MANKRSLVDVNPLWGVVIKSIMKSILAYISLFIFSYPAKSQSVKKIYKKIANTNVYNIESKQLYIFTAGLMIDADGAPKAYHKNDKLALDNLDNAGSPGNWWALATDNGKPSGNPLIQSASDPAPGYYISMTSLENTEKDHSDPGRFVNSEIIPYMVVPAGFSKDFKLGDIAWVYNKKNGKSCFAIYADIGPKHLIGEGSIQLARELGVNSNPKTGGIETGIIYILIRNSGQHKMLTRQEIETIGKASLSAEDIDQLIK